MSSELSLSQGSSAKQRNDEFDSILLSSIMKIANGVFGQTAAEIVLSYIEYVSGFKREEIPARMDQFKQLLEDLLGCGARVVERIIVKDIYTRLGLEMPDAVNFLSAIDNARNVYMRMQGSTLRILSEERVGR